MFPALRFFKESEFRHPEVMNVEFLKWLDAWRAMAGVAFVVTDDGRVEGEQNPSGSAGKHSLHMRGLAVDIRSRNWTPAEKWLVARALILVTPTAPHCVQFEMVYDKDGDQHWHVGVNPSAVVNVLLEADD